MCCQIWVTGRWGGVIATSALSWAYLILLLLIYLDSYQKVVDANSLDGEDDESAGVFLQQRLLRVHRLRLGGRRRHALAGLKH